MQKRLTFFVTSCCLLLSAQASAGTGDLDPTFGTAGIARLGFAQGRAVNVKGSTKLPDGRIVVVGDIASAEDGVQHIVFSRLNNDGTLDTTFGQSGWVTMPAPMSATGSGPLVSCTATGVARGGVSGFVSGLANCGGSIALFSVGLDGTPNVSFGPWGAGSRIDDASALLTARAIAVDSQGRIIVGGSRRSSPTTTSKAFMKRYLADGTPDASFGNAFSTPGLSTASLAVGDSELLALAVDSTDRIVGVGYGTPSLGAPRVMLATRFQANGQVGPFGVTNNAWVSYTGEGDTAHAVAIEGSGTIVVAGTASYTHWNGQSSSKFYVWRLDANGYTTADGAQAIDMPIEIANDADASATALQITQDGWIFMVGGTVSNATATRTAYVCVYPNNTVAAICGNGGRYFGPPSLDGGSVLSLYTASDYKFLSVGRKGDAVAVARFTDSQSGAIDTAYGTNGAATFAPWTAAKDAVNGLAIQADGKLIVAATSHDGVARVARLDASGQPDATFGTGGYYDLDVEGNTRALAAQAAAVQADGKILVALRSEILAGFTAGQAIVMVIRLNADGTRDPAWISYGIDGTPVAIAVKGDGRAVVLASTMTATARMVLAQLGADGSIQSSTSLVGTGAEAEVATALALDANGNALAAGYSRISGVLRMVVYRYSDTLQPDWTWGGGPFSVVDFGVSSAARGVAVRADGKVVLAGACGDTVAHACFALLDANGQPDASWPGGRVTHVLSPSGERAVSAHVTPEGKAFAAIDHAGGLGIALVRADGTLDPAVSGTGSNLPATGGDAIASVMQADGRVVVAGSDGTPEGAAWILARFEPDVVISPPDTMLAFMPVESPTQSRDATMTFVSDKPGSTFECSTEGSAFSPCTSPVVMTGLPEGPHAFRVRAVDATGLKDPTPAERTWIVDLPPTVAITSGPTGLTNMNALTFTFASNDSAATFYCRFDGPMGPMGQGPCPSPLVFGGADGSYVLYVSARDAGGLSSPEVSRSFTIDTQPPTVQITSMPTNPSASAFAAFTFVANESGATFECLLDGSGFAPCVSPFTRTGLAPGQHTFVVRATDAAGNVGAPVPYPWSVNVPAIPPDTTITSGPSGMVGGEAVYTFVSSTLPATFECRVDGLSWFQCASPMNLGIPPPGMHSFEVRAINAYGPDLTPATASWAQAGVPDTTISPVAPPPAPSVTFTLTSTIAGSTFECSIDGGGYSQCATPYTLTGPVGGHTLYVRAKWGNDVDPTPAQSPFFIDGGTPETTITSGPSGVSSGAAVFTFTASVSSATFECSVDGSSYFPCTSPINLGIAPAGAHKFEVRAIANGVPDPTPATATWNQGGVAVGVPDTTITPFAPPPAPSVTFNFTSTIPGSTFECRIDTGTYAPCSTPYTLTGPPGGHTLYVRARTSTDVDPTPAQSPFAIDAPPDTTITQFPPAVTTLTQTTFRYSSNPSGASFECKLDNGGWVNCSTSGITYGGLSHTTHTFQVRARNGSGTDPTPASYTWRIQ